MIRLIVKVIRTDYKSEETMPVEYMVACQEDDADALEPAKATIMDEINEWLTWRREEIEQSFPGYRWCLHVEYDALLHVATVEHAHKDSDPEDMARWN